MIYTSAYLNDKISYGLFQCMHKMVWKSFVCGSNLKILSYVLSNKQNSHLYYHKVNSQCCVINETTAQRIGQYLTDKQTDRLTDRQQTDILDRRTDRHMDGEIANGWIDGWRDGLLDGIGWTDRQMALMHNRHCSNFLKVAMLGGGVASSFPLPAYVREQVASINIMHT